MSKYVITVTPKGKYHFNLVANNGEKILSSQLYAARKGALKGIRSVAKNAPAAPVVDLTAKKVVEAGNPKFEIFAGKDGKSYFRLIAANAKAIGVSEGYNTMAACKNGIKSVKKAAAAEIEKPAKAAAKKAAPAKKAPAKKAAAKKAPEKKAPAKKAAKKK